MFCGQHPTGKMICFIFEIQYASAKTGSRLPRAYPGKWSSELTSRNELPFPKGVGRYLQPRSTSCRYNLRGERPRQIVTSLHLDCGG